MGALATQNWHFSTIYQVQSGMPFTISVFGDTANSGTVLGENPIRANVTGNPYLPGYAHRREWFNLHFRHAPAFTMAMLAGILFTVRRNKAGPGLAPFV